jgi:hypothetical protein
LDYQEKIMRSSIFSSSESPAGPWLRTWLLAAGLVVTLAGAWEGTLRCLGYRPTVVDDQTLWAVQRDRVYSRHGQKAIVLLGDCRMQLDSVPRLLAHRFAGHPVVQLAVEQTSPVATLRDLAADERFDGLVICAVNARLLCEDLWDTQQPYVDFYHHKYTLNERLNRYASVTLEQSLVLLHPELRLDDVIVRLLKTGHLPAPYYLETHADRSRLADYSSVDIAAHRAFTMGRTRWLHDGRMLSGPEEWLEHTRKLEDWVQAIQKRGGDVIFMQFPTSGEQLHYDEFVFPKAQYWDAFAARSSALCIHFTDAAELADFTCPDWSHLDRRDAPRFTRKLAGILQLRGLFQAPSCAGAGEKFTAKESLCQCPGHGKHLLSHEQCSCCRDSGPC